MQKKIVCQEHKYAQAYRYEVYICLVGIQHSVGKGYARRQSKFPCQEVAALTGATLTMARQLDKEEHEACGKDAHSKGE